MRRGDGRVIESTADWAIREMRSPNGGFYSSLDADSEGREGNFYLWTPAEVEAVVGPNVAPLADTYFGITPDGNFEGKNVLRIASELPLGMQGIGAQSKPALLRARNRRTRPGRDDKIQASWNGLMLDALSQIACGLERRDYLKVAVANADFITGAMLEHGNLRHTWQEGAAKIDGFLADYAFVIRALLRLHVATFSGKWLAMAIELANIMVGKFWDAHADVFYDSVNTPDLFIRPRDVFDEAIPSGSSAATAVLIELSRLTGDEKFARIAAKSLEGVRETIIKYPSGTGGWLAALGMLIASPEEIVLAGGKNTAAMEELMHVICTHYFPDAVIAASDPGDPRRLTDLELLKGKSPIEGRPAVYICRNFTCQTPLTDPVELRKQLKKDKLS